MIFLSVFIASFLTADYLITGSVTNTWIGMAILFGTTAALIRFVVMQAARAVRSSHRTRQS